MKPFLLFILLERFGVFVSAVVVKFCKVFPASEMLLREFYGCWRSKYME